MADIEKARKEINECDTELARLFERRMRAVSQVADYKRERGLPIEDLTREREVIARNSVFVKDPALREFYVNFLQSNMDISKNYQRRLLEGAKIAYSGVEGAFADITAARVFPDCQRVPCPDFRSAYAAVERGDCDFAFLPIENSQNGDVGQVMDLAFFGSLYVTGVYQAEIEQNLLAPVGASEESIRTVISHPQALGQCADYILDKGYTSIEAVNTAVAAETVAKKGDITLAAIGSADAAKKYGLKVLRAHINGAGSNTTRFAVFSRVSKTESPSDNSFIMMFTVKNEAGALGRAISAIGEHGFNLRSLKSRPTKALSWNYYFYAEGDGNVNSFDGRRMLACLEPVCMDLKILGCYEKEVIL